MNQKQKQMQQDELTRERMTFLSQQAENQMIVETQRIRAGMIHEAIDALKQAEEEMTLDNIKKWAEELAKFAKNEPEFKKIG